jgi:ribose transport system ATP-binding protein
VSTEAKPALEIAGLSKTFAGTRALQDASLTVKRGEILALLGENGAGKSTLIKILAGVHQADAGSITLGGVPLDGDPRRRPISFIHQDLGLVDDMTVAENIALVNGFPRRGPLISWKAVRRMAELALAVSGARLRPLPCSRLACRGCSSSGPSSTSIRCSAAPR